MRWECECGKIFVSNSFRHHQMDVCKKCQCGVDLEEYGCRLQGSYLIANRDYIIKDFDYNFFDEIIIGMKEQGFETTIKIGNELFLPMEIVYLAREFEDEILEGLK